MTYNILLGGEGCRVDAIGRVVESIRPDIVGIQEANDEVVLRDLASRWGMHALLARSPSRFHVALLSRYSIEPEPATAETGRLAKNVVRGRVQTPSRPLSVAVGHLSAQPWHRPGAQAFRRGDVAEFLRLSAGADILMADCNALAPGDRLRPSDPPPDSGGPFPRYPMWINRWVLAAARRRGLRPLLRLLIHLEMPREIVGSILAAGWVDAYRRARPYDAGYTWPIPWPLARIDFMFARPTLAGTIERATRVQTPLAWRASDHLPVVVDFRPVG